MNRRSGKATGTLATADATAVIDALAEVREVDAEDRCLLDEGPSTAHGVSDADADPARKFVGFPSGDLALEQNVVTGPHPVAGVAVDTDAGEDDRQLVVEEQLEMIWRILNIH